MRALVQRVNSAQVEAGGDVLAQIDRGLLVYLGVETCDNPECANRLAEKIAHLRIFEDAQSKLNLSVQDVGGDVLAVSSFTLMADASKGRRPSFVAAAAGEAAQSLYEAFIASLAQQGCRVANGAFGEHMMINSLADGPVNIIVDFPPAAAPG